MRPGFHHKRNGKSSNSQYAGRKAGLFVRQVRRPQGEHGVTGGAVRGSGRASVVRSERRRRVNGTAIDDRGDL